MTLCHNNDANQNFGVDRGAETYICPTTIVCVLVCAVRVYTSVQKIPHFIKTLMFQRPTDANQPYHSEFHEDRSVACGGQ